METINKKEIAELEAIADKPKAATPHHTRFSDALWYDPNFPGIITVGGAGGIGSWLSLLLSRAGYQLHIYDHDNIDETNMAGQFYPAYAIGGNKAGTVATLCNEFGAVENMPFSFGRFTKETPARPFCFATFDNMAARKLMFEAWKSNARRQLFVDGRMLAEAGQIYFVTPATQEAYESQLFDDKEVVDQPCSMKATSHCGAHIASLMVAGFTNYISNLKLDADVREVPFKVEFELPLLMTTTKTAEQCISLIVTAV